MTKQTPGKLYLDPTYSHSEAKIGGKGIINIPFIPENNPDGQPCIPAEITTGLIHVEQDEEGNVLEMYGVIAFKSGPIGLYATHTANELRELATAYTEMARQIEERRLTPGIPAYTEGNA